MSEEAETFDVLILGAGTAGLNARKPVEKAGMSYRIFDPGPFGTTCARVGCMPSKLLIAAGEAADRARRADMFGVRIPEVSVDGPAVLRRVQRERDRFVSFTLETLDTLAAEGKLIRERACLCSPDSVRAGGKTYTARRGIVLATGTHPFLPGVVAGLEDLVWTSDEVFEIADLPKSLLVIGCGVIGLELGQALHHLGVEVTVVGRGGHVGLFAEDPMREVAIGALRAAGLHFAPDARGLALSRVEGGVSVTFEDDDGKRTKTVERILVATGRRPNLDNLGLKETGVDLVSLLHLGLLPLDPSGRLADSRLFLAGDVHGLRGVLHEASDDGRFAGAAAMAWPDPSPEVKRRVPLSIAFTDPQQAIVGEHPEDAAVGEVDWTRQGRSRIWGLNVGRTRVFGDCATGRLVGAEMCGPHAEHLAHLVAWAIGAELTVEAALRMPFYHPVFEEGLRTALEDLRSRLPRR